MDDYVDGQDAWCEDPAWVANSDYVAFKGMAYAAFEVGWKEHWGIGHEFAPSSIDPDMWEDANRFFADANRICEILCTSTGRQPPPALRELSDKLKEDSDREIKEWFEEFEEIEALVDESAREPAIEKHANKDLEAPMRLALFDTSMEILVYKYFEIHTGDLAARAVELVRSMIRVKGEATRQYLGRVAVCYVNDMRPELAVMARAVIEAALRDCVDETTVSTRGKRHPKLHDWIEAARTNEILPHEAYKAAHDVRQAGNDVIHTIPQQAPERQVTLAQLITVLEAIEDVTKR
jgi:hypothetical protein